MAPYSPFTGSGRARCRMGIEHVSRVWTKNTGSLRPVFTSKAWYMLALVTAGVAVVVMVGCPFHCAALGLAQASLPAAHRTSCPQATSGLTCCTATLASAVSLKPLFLSTPYTTDLMAPSTEFALPPFIPPRPAVCSHQLTVIEHPLGA